MSWTAGHLRWTTVWIALGALGCGSTEKPQTEELRGAKVVKAKELQLSATNSERSADPLRIAVGGDIIFKDTAGTRNESRTVRFDVRDSDGSKTALVTTSLEPGDALRYRASIQGYVSVHRCTRPRSVDAHPNAWQMVDLCEVTHVRVGEGRADGDQGDRLLSTKIGLPVELRPYLSTANLRSGDSLPVRLYQFGYPMAAHSISATSPSGQTQEVVTNKKGVSELAIDETGKWVVEARVQEKAMPSGYSIARLIFDVSASPEEKEVR